MYGLNYNNHILQLLVKTVTILGDDPTKKV